MVAEPWILNMGNQVNSNSSSGHSLAYDNSKKFLRNVKQVSKNEKKVIGILSFEVANAMSRVIHLHKSLSQSEILRLKNEILKSEGIRTLVSDDDSHLVELAIIEKLDELHRVASVVSRLGKRCTVPALQGFEHVFGDITCGVIDVRELGFLVKDMEGMVRKMERYVGYTARLYSEMEVMNELEVATKKFLQNQHEESRKAFEQKLSWQKQDVRHLQDVSLWNQTYDKVVELLARTVCTIFARISALSSSALFVGSSSSVPPSGILSSRSGSLHHVKQESGQKSITQRKIHNGSHFKKPIATNSDGHNNSGPIKRVLVEKRSPSFTPHQTSSQRSEGGLFGPEDFNFACGMGPGRLFMECINLSSSNSKVDDDDHDDRSQISGCFSVSTGLKRDQPSPSGCLGRSFCSVPFSGDQARSKFDTRFSTKSNLAFSAPPNTIGSAALALHYANIIIVIEKLLCYPHLVGEEARDDLYQMLPTSLRRTLKTKLKSYIKDLAIYDAPLAHDWKEKLDAILKWLAPLAHNMIRWQSERNFEQQQIVTRTNVLLLQTLYFADREKAETVICELLVGLNYICRYEQQQNALMDCASSFDFEDCLEWQMQFRSSFRS